MLALSLLLLAVAGTYVQAQSQSQIQSCANTIRLISYEANPTWATTDDTHYFNATYTYDPALCTSPSQVPVNRIYLANLNGASYNCPRPPFDNTGTLYTQCTQTLGFVSRAAKEGDVDWGIIMTIGVRPTLYTIEDDFTVNSYDPPQPSGLRRRHRVSDQEAFICPTGESYCPVTSDSFECVNTASNLYSCGACPSDPRAQDCSNIPGGNNVECRNSQCFVSSCARGYQVSFDRKSCIPHGKRR